MSPRKGRRPYAELPAGGTRRCPVIHCTAGARFLCRSKRPREGPWAMAAIPDFAHPTRVGNVL